MADVIEGVELIALNFPYHAKVQFRSSQGTGGAYTLLRLTTRDGAQGIAEVTGIPNIPDSDAAVLQAQFDRFFRPLLAGADPLDMPGITTALTRIRGAAIAKALIDTALWDLKGKILNQPVWRLLGGKAPKPVPVTAILFGDTAEAMLANAERTLQRGIRALKIKLWKHTLEDVHLVRDLRALAGEDVLIYADANHAYSESEARALLPQLQPYNVAMIEDPCNLPAERLAEVARVLPMPILGEIPIDSLEIAERYVAAKAIGAVSVHPRRTGLTETLAIVALCERAGVPAIVGTDLESSLGVLARLHLRGAIPALEPWPSEVQFFETLAGSVVAGPPAVIDGAIAVPGGPGFGAVVDEAKLQHYRAKG